MKHKWVNHSWGLKGFWKYTQCTGVTAEFFTGINKCANMVKDKIVMFPSIHQSDSQKERCCRWVPALLIRDKGNEWAGIGLEISTEKSTHGRHSFFSPHALISSQVSSLSFIHTFYRLFLCAVGLNTADNCIQTLRWWTFMLELPWFPWFWWMRILLMWPISGDLCYFHANIHTDENMRKAECHVVAPC